MLSESVTRACFKNKAIIILGPRQVGKTTLVAEILKKLKVSFLHLNGDESDIR